MADPELHQQFHDSLAATWQKAFGITDEEHERVTGQPVAERDRRLLALAEGPAARQGAQEES